jgi:transposase
MWTEEQRAIYRRDEDRYPSNLTDAEWERLKPLIPEALPGGRPRKTDMRAAMNAIFYLLRTGCPWRYLPRDEFPPRSTVYNIFRKFHKDGVWEAIWEELHMTLREQLGREASPTAAVIDSQTLKAAEKGAVLMVRQAMTPGRRSRGARFTPWSTPKACRCGPSFIPLASRTAMARRLSSTRSVTAFPGSNWSGRTMATTRGKSKAVAKVPVLRLEIVKRSDDLKGFVVLPRRWVVERTFSWFGRNRRIAKDYENLAGTLAAFVTLACIQIAIRRLAR